ncbi:MAG: hypothetical protein U9R57_03445 [Thermodesulfobacteriota bacterium]|nr:hypothetical protein [Thermodesulfobacteriota bacterium]
MKSKNLLLVAGLAVFSFTSSQTFALSDGEMIDGMSLSTEKHLKNGQKYKYDNAPVNIKESMIESDAHSEECHTPERHYAGDCSCPSAEQLMSEGIDSTDSTK